MVSLAIMAHPSRKERAEALCDRLKPFNPVIVWDEKSSEWETGSRALLAYEDSDFHLVIQDDAVISGNFYVNVLAALDSIPSESLISFYTGKVKPAVRQTGLAVAAAQVSKSSWLKGQTLFWGVAIAVPTKYIEAIVAQKSTHLYDRRVGEFFYKRYLPVWYTNPSIVDHAQEPSLVSHDVSEPRVAHIYEPDLVRFNSTFVDFKVFP